MNRYKIIESAKTADEREYLATCLKKITRLENEKYFACMDNFELYLWHFDNIYPVTNTYGLEIINYNENEFQRIERFCKGIKVNQINYLSSIYDITEDDRLDISLKVKEVNE